MQFLLINVQGDRFQSGDSTAIHQVDAIAAVFPSDADGDVCCLPRRRNRSELQTLLHLTQPRIAASANRELPLTPSRAVPDRARRCPFS